MPQYKVHRNTPAPEEVATLGEIIGNLKQRLDAVEAKDKSIEGLLEDMLKHNETLEAKDKTIQDLQERIKVLEKSSNGASTQQ